MTILNLAGNLLINTLPYRKDPAMASHRREAPSLTVTVLGMIASALLLAMGIWAAFTSPHPSAVGPMFQPLLPAAAPPSPEPAPEWTIQSAADLVLARETPAATPPPAPTAQKSVPVSIPKTGGTPKFSAPAETPSVSIQKPVTRHNDQKPRGNVPAPVPPPSPNGSCSGTASQCLDNIQSAPLTEAIDIGITADGRICLKLMNSGCL